MSRQKSKTGPMTEFFDKSDLRQHHKQQKIKEAKRFKDNAIKEATAPMSSCAIVAILLLVAVIATPTLGVLVLFA